MQYEADPVANVGEADIDRFHPLRKKTRAFSALLVQQHQRLVESPAFSSYKLALKGRGRQTDPLLPVLKRIYLNFNNLDRTLYPHFCAELR